MRSRARRKVSIFQLTLPRRAEMVRRLYACMAERAAALSRAQSRRQERWLGDDIAIATNNKPWRRWRDTRRRKEQR
jgi:hypothetical protein